MSKENQQIPQVIVNLTQGMSKKSWILLIIEALVFILIFGSITKCNNDKIDKLEHNIYAYKDTIEYVEMKNGELMAMKESLILSESEAREELDITKKELKDLKKKLDSDVAYIAQLKSQIGIKDTIWMKPDTVIIVDTTNNVYRKSFNWSDKWVNVSASIKGPNIEDAKLSINNLKMDVPVELGLSDNYTFWIKSPNPYVSFTDISSAVINNSSVKKKEKRFHHGIYLGFGVQYGLFGKQWDFGPQAGYAFMYSF